MRCSIAIYPDSERKRQVKKWEAYIKRAGDYGFSEIFTTLHLPEIPLEQQVEMLKELAVLAKRYHMELTADIGGKQIDDLLGNEKLNREMRQIGLDLIRLDYGFSLEQVRAMYDAWQLKGFVINASLYSEKEVENFIPMFYEIDVAMELRACHNFYPRMETGLDSEFAKEQARIFSERGIPVYFCIPSLENPRLPMFEGLPTVEKHRNMELEEVVSELLYEYGSQGLMAADEFFSEEQLSCISRVEKKEPFRIRARLQPGISEAEREAVLTGIHHIRYDSNCVVLRSQSSREMSQYAGNITPRETGTRTRGMITVDNTGYSRYSGEVQFVLSELEADERVNIVGQVLEKDMWKFQYYREGYDYICIETEAEEGK